MLRMWKLEKNRKKIESKKINKGENRIKK
jgi:hypothetical protein